MCHFSPAPGLHVRSVIAPAQEEGRVPERAVETGTQGPSPQEPLGRARPRELGPAHALSAVRAHLQGPPAPTTVGGRAPPTPNRPAPRPPRRWEPPVPLRPRVKLLVQPLLGQWQTEVSRGGDGPGPDRAWSQGRRQ
ncbi:proline-rich protein 2-like [Meles meles]|uniref:proline-rich protein 2-like n=1 Tax=Meles meles TaxID=9662 RepID=UPI001E69E76F|nr:proline-rich protein 2-like [Meles meles]